jgi:glycosyltransferase involved in cell wall biosynthesis
MISSQDCIHKSDISVIIPAYNAENSIINTMESVRLQTVKPSSVIVVDDGSSDSTARIVSEYIVRYHLLDWEIVSQPNAGPSAARDLGIRKANSNYIALLDADDEWDLSKLEIFLYFALVGNFDILGAGLKPLRGRAKSRTIRSCHFLYRNPYFTSSVIFRRSSYLATRGFDINQRYSEDYKLWLTFAWSNMRCGIVSNPLTHYHRLSNATHSGLSSHTALMQAAEVRNFRELRRQKLIPTSLAVAAETISWLKYFRRIFLLKWRLR